METRFLWQRFILNDGKGKNHVETKVMKDWMNAFAMRMEKNANVMGYLQREKWHNLLINSV